MTSNRKQFTVAREMLTTVARDQSVLLKVERGLIVVLFCFAIYITNLFKGVYSKSLKRSLGLN